MVALVHGGILPDPAAQAEAERIRTLRERALRGRDGRLPAHLLHRGVIYPLRPLPYPYGWSFAD